MQEIKIYSSYKDHVNYLLQRDRSLCKMISKLQWQIQPSTAHKWNQILPLIDMTNIIKLTFQGCDNSVLKNPLYIIIHISFTSLQKLYLGHTNIKSIEQLTNLDAPNLIELSLGKYRNIKFSIEQLKLNLYAGLTSKNFDHYDGNHILDPYVLCQLQSNDKMNQLIIDFPIDDRPQGENINWVAKLGQKQIQKFYLQAKQKIINRTLQRMLVNKYPRGKFGRNA